jgi:hypothetical protein
MRPSRCGRANLDESGALDVNGRDDRHIHGRRRCGNRGRAAARAEARAILSVLVMIRWRAVLVPRMGHGRHGVMAMDRARVEAPRVEERGLKPDSPKRHESAQPNRTAHQAK